jgi:hypothetical protein
MSDLTLDRLKAWLADDGNCTYMSPVANGLIKRKRFVTSNGYKISIQMSESHHCVPGESVEMWYCPHNPLLIPYGNGEDPYAFVPLEVVAGYIDSLESLPSPEKQK